MDKWKSMDTIPMGGTPVLVLLEEALQFTIQIIRLVFEVIDLIFGSRKEPSWPT